MEKSSVKKIKSIFCYAVPLRAKKLQIGILEAGQKIF